jgi:serine/threonine-protein kinase
LWVQRDHEQALSEFERAQQGGVDAKYFIALAEWGRGNPERAVTILSELCDTYDPRNGGVCRSACTLYLRLRDYSEADRYCDRNIALLPNDIDALAVKAEIVVRRSGDIEEARRLLHSIPGVINSSSGRILQLVFLDLLDSRYNEALNMLASSSATLYQSITSYEPKPLLYAKVYALMDSMQMARACYDSASAVLEADLAKWPEDGRIHSALGIAYAGVGRRDDAVRHGKRAVKLSMASRYLGPRTVAALAEIYVMVNEHDAAIDQLEKHLSAPGELSVSLLRLDPTWDPLRDHPRFQALLAKYE